MRRLLLAAALGIALPGAVSAATLVESTFETSDEGWVQADFFVAGGSQAVQRFTIGGNPGGFIRGNDNFAAAGFQAPSSFLGNMSAAYGGVLHVDQRLVSSDNLNYPMALLTSGSLRLQFRTPPPGTSWTSYDIPLLASAGWEISDGGDNAADKPDANEAQLLLVLSNLTRFTLRVDWRSGSDTVDLDNVRFESVAVIPEPETYALMLAGLGLLGFVARRRRSLTSTAIAFRG